MPSIRAIIFDFDGIIVDSEPAHCRAIGAALATIGLDFPHRDNFARYIGRGDRECLAEIAAEQSRPLSSADMEHLMRAKAAAFLEAAAAGDIRPYPGSVELIRAAAERAPVAVCSGSIREVIEPVLELLGLTGTLATLVTATDVARNKPDPAPYLLTASRLGLDPAACAAVEDSPTGIRSALGAGCRVHGICHSFPADRLSAAHHTHARIADLTPDLLLGLTPAL